MNVKKFLALLLVLAMFASLMSGCGKANEPVPSEKATTAENSASADKTNAEPEFIVKFSHNGPGKGAQFDGQTFFKERLEELSNGRIRVDLYPGASLAEKAGSMEGLQLGTIEATEVSLIDMSSYNSKWEVFAMPYFFDSDDQACKLCRDPKVYDILESNAEDNGFIVLSFVTVGSRDIFSKKPINSVADMKGLKIRVMNSNGLVTAMNDMGASPMPSLAWSDCYSGMQQGVIDAVENSTEVVFSNGFTELPGAYSFTHHFTIPDLLLFSKAVYDSMPVELQEAVIQAGIDTQNQWNDVIYKNATETALKTMEESGVEMIHPDLTGFQEAAAKTRDTLSASFSNDQMELYNAICEVKDNYK